MKASQAGFGEIPHTMPESWKIPIWTCRVSSWHNSAWNSLLWKVIWHTKDRLLVQAHTLPSLSDPRFIFPYTLSPCDEFAQWYVKPQEFLDYKTIAQVVPEYHWKIISAAGMILE